MTDQSMSVSGPVKVISDSHQRVAFELAQKVDYYAGEVVRDKAYWLTLYGQCLQTVNGRDVHKVLSGQ